MKRTNTHSDAFLSCIHTDGRIDWPRERGGERDKETTPSEPEPKDHVVGDLEKAESFARFLFRFQTFSLAGQAFMPEQANSYKR